MQEGTIGAKLAKSAAVTLLISLACFYLGDRFGLLIIELGGDFFGSYLDAIAMLPGAIASDPFLVSTEIEPLMYGGGFALIVWMVWLRYSVFIGNYRAGEESGSARWGTCKEGEAFKDTEHPDNNLLFTEHFGMALKRGKFDLEHDRNMNVTVIGGSGSGKTRYYVKPNIMQMNASYFVTDPKGTLIEEVGHLFAAPESGYEVKSFNTIDFSRSMHYNPLAYVKTDSDILSFVNCLIANTNGKKESGGDKFWEDSERLLYIALIAFLRDWCADKFYSLDGLLTLLSMAEARENDENFKSPLDLLFLQIETGMKYIKKDSAPAAPASAKLSRDVMWGASAQGGSTYTKIPSKFKRKSDGVCPYEKGGLSPNDDYALLNYNMFKVAAGKTLKSIIISCNVRLSKIAIREVRDLLKYDEMELDRMGDPNRPKTALFSVMSDTDKSFSFLHAIMMWQTLDQLCRHALIAFGGKLPVPVNFIFDEFANIGTIPDIEETIAVVRSRNIGITIILQSVSQLESRYDKAAQTIIDCCDTTLFLGGKSTATNEEIAKMIGKQTIHQMTYNESQGQSPSASKNMQIQGRDLIDAAEIGKLSRRKAILLISGTNPLLDDKYPLESHPRYEWIDPGHEGGKFTKPFDFVAYMEQRREAQSSK